MPDGGSVIAMTLLRRRRRSIPGYNVMGVAKAALEATARYLAFDLGEQKIRVNMHLRRPDPARWPRWPSAASTRCSTTRRTKGPAEPQHRRRRGRQDRGLPAQRPVQRRDGGEDLRRCGVQHRRAVIPDGIRSRELEKTVIPTELRSEGSRAGIMRRIAIPRSLRAEPVRDDGSRDRRRRMHAEWSRAGPLLSPSTANSILPEMDTTRV